jgi:hypothetical protein
MNEIIATQNNLPAHLAGRIAELRAKAKTAPEVWAPESGDCLVGQLVGLNRASGIYGDNDQIIVKVEDGSHISAWLTEWLRSNLRAQNATIGCLIALTFLGKRSSPAGRTFNAYSLVIDKA